MPEVNFSDKYSQMRVLGVADRSAADFVKSQSDMDNEAPKHPDGTYWGYLGNTYQTLGSVQAIRSVTDPLITGAYSYISNLFGGDNTLVSDDKELVTKESFQYQFERATPQLRNDLTSLAENGYLRWNMPKSELNDLLDTTSEIRTRQEELAAYTENWGTAHHLIASLPVMVADPLNYIPVGGAVNAIRQTALASRSIAGVLAAKTVFGGVRGALAGTQYLWPRAHL